MWEYDTHSSPIAKREDSLDDNHVATHVTRSIGDEWFEKPSEIDPESEEQRD